MINKHVTSGGLSMVHALAFAGVAALGACGAPTSSGGGSGSFMRGDGGAVTPADGGAAGGCAAVCANARRAMCGAFNEGCVAACNQLVAQVPARCAAPLNAYLACAGAARIVCASDGPEITGCDAQDGVVNACVEGSGPEPTPTDRCLPDSAIPDDIAASLCTRTPGMPVPHDCPGGAPSAQCVAAPSGEANVFCCAR